MGWPARVASILYFQDFLSSQTWTDRPYKQNGCPHTREIRNQAPHWGPGLIPLAEYHHIDLIVGEPQAPVLRIEIRSDRICECRGRKLHGPCRQVSF
jgi:hypothetical protein